MEILICVFGNGFSHFCFAQSFVILVIKEGDPNMRFYHSGLGLVSSNKEMSFYLFIYLFYFFLLENHLFDTRLCFFTWLFLFVKMLSSFLNIIL